jgi:NADP-reducing hydrogenase subunit HndB
MVAVAKIKSLAELRKIKEAASAQARIHGNGKTRVVVRLGTCSVAADAHSVARALAEEVQKRDLDDDVIVETRDCSRRCRGEPFVDVIGCDASSVTYGHVKLSNVFRIVDEHIVNGQVVQDLVAPSED